MCLDARVFLGHYSTSLLAKRLVPETPLWTLVLATQLVDVVWGVLVPLGVERMSLDDSLPSNPLVLEYMPYSHSLLSNVLWAAAAFVVAYLWLRKVAPALAIALTVLSHWVLDVVVHRPDMGLLGADVKLGLGLWNYPLVALGVEIVLFLGAAHLLFHSPVRERLRPKGFIVFTVGMFLLGFVFWFGPTPPHPSIVALSGLAFFLGVSFWASRIEKRRA